MLTFRHSSTDSPFSSDRGSEADLLYTRCRGEGVSYPGWDGPGADEGVSGGNPLGDVWRGGRVPPETPAPFGVLLAQDLLLTLTLLLGAQVAVLLLQEPHRRPALLLKMSLVLCRQEDIDTYRKCVECIDTFSKGEMDVLPLMYLVLDFIFFAHEGLMCFFYYYFHF